MLEAIKQIIGPAFRKLNKKLCTLNHYHLLQDDKMGGSCSKHGRNEKRIHILDGKFETKRPLRRSRRRWKNNMNREIREIELVVLDWIHMAQARDHLLALLNTVMKLRVP
jgi:hypothetical protein